MTPYISHRSTFIIFIISINIVSMVCLYEPIKEEPAKPNQRKFTYFNYLRAPNHNIAFNLKKLNVDQYYSAYYNKEYRTMPNVKDHFCYVSSKRILTSYCDEEYVSQSHFETNYLVAEFGNFINILRKCLNEDSVTFSYLQLCCNPNRSTTEEPVKCLAVLEHRDVATNCIEDFSKGLRNLFKQKPENLKYTDDLEFTKSIVGKRAEIAFGIATSQKNPNELDDETFEQLLADYKVFTGDTTYTDDRENFKNECLKSFEEYYDESVYDKWRSKYIVFNGFNNFHEFSREIKMSVKYLEALEGKLGNNKELYDKFHENPISKYDYYELLTILPLKHENFYPLYFMRLKFLGYIPVDESTWNEQMSEFKKVRWTILAPIDNNQLYEYKSKN